MMSDKDNKDEEGLSKVLAALRKANGNEAEKQYQLRLKAKQDFFESAEFNRLIAVFKKHADPICETKLKKASPGDYSFTAEEFNRVCESLFTCKKDDIKGLDSVQPYSNFGSYSIDYADLRFSVMVGTGGSYYCHNPKP